METPPPFPRLGDSVQLLGLQLVADSDTDPRFGFCLVRLDEDARGRRARPPARLLAAAAK